MSRPRVYPDAASQQRAYRQRLKALRREAQGATEAQLARAGRDLHLRLEYLAATTSSSGASKLVGEDTLGTLRNVVARLFEIEGF